jgi:hypothetical protein
VNYAYTVASILVYILIALTYHKKHYNILLVPINTILIWRQTIRLLDLEKTRDLTGQNEQLFDLPNWGYLVTWNACSSVWIFHFRNTSF